MPRSCGTCGRNIVDGAEECLACEPVAVLPSEVEPHKLVSLDQISSSADKETDKQSRRSRNRISLWAASAVIYGLFHVYNVVKAASAQTTIPYSACWLALGAVLAATYVCGGGMLLFGKQQGRAILRVISIVEMIFWVVGSIVLQIWLTSAIPDAMNAYAFTGYEQLIMQRDSFLFLLFRLLLLAIAVPFIVYLICLCRAMSKKPEENKT
jgi:hypothetical protein